MLENSSRLEVCDLGKTLLLILFSEDVTEQSLQLSARERMQGGYHSAERPWERGLV